jgi:hypothetical protein
MIWQGILRAMLLLTVVWTTIAAAANKQPVGVVAGDVFTDQLYGIRFEKTENWKFGKIEKEEADDPRHLRLTATQTNFIIPENRKFSQENFNSPEIGLWVDTSSLTVEQFAEELKSRKSKLKARKDIDERFRMMVQGNHEEQLKIQLDGVDGCGLRFSFKYQAQIRNAALDTYNLIDELRLGDIYFVKYAGKMVVVFFSSERPTYRLAKEDVEAMLLKIKIKPVQASDTTGTKG